MILIDAINHIKEAQKIILTTHIAPDGDALGTVTGMYKVFKKMGKEVDAFVDDEIPDMYSFVPNIDKISKPFFKEADVVLIFDCADEERLGRAKELLKSKAATINIDHHISNTLYAKMNYVDTNAAATAEIAYQIVKLLGVDFDEEISTSFYTAILTDTGGFMYESTTSITHQIAGDLINNGAKFKEVGDKVFNSIKFNKAKLLGRALDSLTLYGEGKIAYMEILKRDFEETNTDLTQIENIINYGRNVEGVEVAVLLIEKEDEVKISLRSKEKVDVNKIANIFGGGGHIRASGCSIKGNIDEAKEKILQAIFKEFEG
ncbi:bifunctional oligoribonuclease and PAP phosphatase NrnA [Thermoanaerobacter kivui]|uniref:Bifunctional oligoribonuclease and PAP phosphatase NrnA n=1 Tax=Thermoanaerobacter kivui TaxID=2325 RepID=A0A097ARP5_THEKI|nr:bifunctional oligoribonuclease/PAP phosphatase NrnA [Thermoanaerobacter kivui]AIS52479.1 bifunctional oligoribonuclease and PAP phosphatase NrnA [Thermoanaerobacter kivui]